MNTIPIIRIELESMRMQLRTALSAYQIQLDTDLKEAVDRYCTPENLKRIVDTCVFQTLDTVIAEEVKNFYVKGEGRKVIKEEIERRLRNNETFTVIDS